MYGLFLTLRGLAQALPLEGARWLGRALGQIAYWVLPAYRRLSIEHMAFGLGDALNAKQREQVTRRLFANLGQTFLEWLYLPKLTSKDLQSLISGEGINHIREVLAKGNGAIVVSPHFSNWELIAIYLRSLGFQGGILARRLRYSEYEAFLIAMRGDKGVNTFVRGSVREVAKLLRENQIIGLMPDQDTDSLEGIFIDFLGHPAYTPVGPAALSVMTGAPIIPCFMVREGKKFRLMIEPAVAAKTTVDRKEAMKTITQEWSDVMASYIKRYPEQWVWMHERWKTQPPVSGGESSAPNASTAPRGPQVWHPVFSCLLIAGFGLLFAASIAGCGKPTAQQPKTPAAQAGAPGSDQQMTGFTIAGYDEENGAKRWELEGTRASMDGEMVLIQEPNAIGHDAERTAYLTARHARVNERTHQVQLQEDVTIHTTDGIWLTTPHLSWVPDQNLVTTGAPVRIESDHFLLRGNGMRGYSELKTATILKDIELVLNPTDDEPVNRERKQVIITCEGPLALDYKRSIATFEKNVHVNDPNGDMYSDVLVAYLNPDTRTIRYAEANGNVRIFQQKHQANSDRAVYEPAIGKITLVGKPSLLLSTTSPRQQPGLVLEGQAADSAKSGE